jgi:hypothetical protein
MSASTTVLFAEEVRIRNWTALRPGDRILIDELFGNRWFGVVDQVAETGDFLWIRYSELNSRRLIHAEDVAGITCRTADIEPPRLAALAKDPLGSIPAALVPPSY